MHGCMDGRMHIPMHACMYGRMVCIYVCACIKLLKLVANSPWVNTRQVPN